MPKVQQLKQRKEIHLFPERPVDALVVPFDREGEIVVKRVGRVVRQSDAVPVRCPTLYHSPVDKAGEL